MACQRPWKLYTAVQLGSLPIFQFQICFIPANLLNYVRGCIRLVPPNGFRNSDPTFVSKWTSNYNLLIGSFKIQAHRSRFRLILAISVSKRLWCNSGNWQRKTPTHFSFTEHVCLLQPWGDSAHDLQKLILEHKMKQTFTISSSMKLNTFPLAVPALIISEDLWVSLFYLFKDVVYTVLLTAAGSLTFFYMSLKRFCLPVQWP